MLESNLEALRTENRSLQQRLDKALQELVRAATPSNPAVLRAFKVLCVLHVPGAQQLHRLTAHAVSLQSSCTLRRHGLYAFL